MLDHLVGSPPGLMVMHSTGNRTTYIFKYINMMLYSRRTFKYYVYSLPHITHPSKKYPPRPLPY